MRLIWVLLSCYLAGFGWTASSSGIVRRSSTFSDSFPSRLIARTNSRDSSPTRQADKASALGSQQQRAASPARSESTEQAPHLRVDPATTGQRQRIKPGLRPMNVMGMDRGPIKIPQGRGPSRVRKSPPARPPSPEPQGQVLAGGPSFAAVVGHGPAILQAGVNRELMQEIEVPPGKTRLLSAQGPHSAFANGIPYNGGHAVTVATGPAVAGLGYVLHPERHGFVKSYRDGWEKSADMVFGHELRKDVQDDGSGKPNAGTTAGVEGPGHVSAVALRRID